MQQYVILERVQAHDQIGAGDWPVIKLLLEARDLLIQLVDHFRPAATQDLLAVGDASGNPTLEQMIAFGELSSAGDGSVLSITSSHKQDHATSPRHLLDNLGRAAQMGGGNLEGDDVDALSDAVDVACVCGVP